MRYFVKETDTILFSPNFQSAVLVGNLSVSLSVLGLRTVFVAGQKVCVASDVQNVKIFGVGYTNPAGGATIPGTGNIILSNLSDIFLASSVLVNGERVWVYSFGAQLPAEFQVVVPAQKPGTPPVPDTILSFLGFATIQGVQTQVYTI